MAASATRGPHPRRAFCSFLATAVDPSPKLRGRGGGAELVTWPLTGSEREPCRSASPLPRSWGRGRERGPPAGAVRFLPEKTSPLPRRAFLLVPRNGGRPLPQTAGRGERGAGIQPQRDRSLPSPRGTSGEGSGEGHPCGALRCSSKPIQLSASPSANPSGDSAVPAPGSATLASPERYAPCIPPRPDNPPARRLTAGFRRLCYRRR